MSENAFQKFYHSGTVGLAVTGLAQIWLGTKGDPALFATGLATLAGVLYPAVASKRLSNQVKDGKFDSVDVVDQVIQGIPEVVKRASSAAADLERIKQAAEAVAVSAPTEALEAVTAALKR